jgi:hypothetical protein
MKHFIVILLLFLTSIICNRVTAQTYSTDFPLTENPISEGGAWVNGGTIGLDWTNVRTASGIAYGTQSGGSYNDSTALLTGTWKANQQVEATVYTVNQNSSVFQEVEIRLRSSLSAHRATGYEINFRCLKTGAAYSEIVRWNGPLGDFTYLSTISGSKYGVANGDIVKATIMGNVISVYINNVLILTATDSTYSSGNPGLGFCCGSSMSDFGFTSFTATGSTSPPSSHYTLTVLKSGTGAGYVTSSPSGISCGSTCSMDYTSGTVVTLTAIPEPGSSFTGWSGGGCSGTGDCISNGNEDKSVTATFTLNSSPPSGGSGGSGSGCFIATAAYGSHLDPHVYVLRDFRDRYLLTNSLGRSFVNSYYRYAPPVAVYIEKHETLKITARLALTPVVCCVKYPYTAPLMLLGISGSIIWVIRRRN